MDRQHISYEGAVKPLVLRAHEKDLFEEKGLCLLIVTLWKPFNKPTESQFLGLIWLLASDLALPYTNSCTAFFPNIFILHRPHNFPHSHPPLRHCQYQGHQSPRRGRPSQSLHHPCHTLIKEYLTLEDWVKGMSKINTGLCGRIVKFLLLFHFC